MEGSNQGRGVPFVGAPTMFDQDTQQYNSVRGGSAFQETGDPWIVNYLTASASEGPWHPPVIPLTTSQVGGRSPSSGDFQTLSFQGYRNSRIPSECDTIPDSGYGGSRPPYSIDTTSNFEEDHNPEAQVTAHRIETLQLGSDVSNPAHLMALAQPSRSAGAKTASVGIDSPNYCQDCNAWFRTKSELNKHKLRHSKPFKCDIERCPRGKEGFGTSNDLDRHKKSVHSDRTVAGPRFICRLGNCANKEKLWPRADNFRQHLKRIHQRELSADDNLDEYIFREPLNQEPLRQDLKGIGTAITCPNTESASSNSQTRNANFHSFLESQAFNSRSIRGFTEMQASLNILQRSTPTTTEKDASRLPSVQEVEEHFIQPQSLNGNAARSSRSMGAPLLTPPGLSYQYAGSNHGSMVEDDNSFMEVEEDNFAAPPSLPGEENEEQPPRASDVDLDSHSDGAPASTAMESTDTVMINAEKAQSTPSLSPTILLPEGPYRPGKDQSKVLEFLKTIPKELLENALKSDASDSQEGSSQSSSSNRHQHACPECNKSFNRQCELKKHKKRHEKPYGCTYSNCSKTFGSKNDWKRHESSQHCQLEYWQCEDTKMNESEPCKKVFQRRDSFKHHLQRDHALMDPKEIEMRVEKCKIGRHCKPHFWCGFCEKMIEIGSENVNAWTKRCDHIDDHFCGRDGRQKRNISEWIYPADSEEQWEDTSKKSRSSQSTKQPNPLKRQRSSDALPKAPKRHQTKDAPNRQLKELLYVWKCCSCNALTNVKTADSCIECSHRRCDMFCEVEVSLDLGMEVTADPK